MSRVLKLLALILFVVVVVIAIIDSTPDPIQMIGLTAAGLAFWVASELEPTL